MMKAIPIKIVSATLALVCAVALYAPSVQAVTEKPLPQVSTPAPKSVHPDTVPEDTAATEEHWNKAKQYQRQQRFELARQSYLLALSTCRTEETRDRLQRELQIVDLQLRTMR